MREQPVTHDELIDIALKAEKYNGAGRDTVLRLVARIRELEGQLRRTPVPSVTVQSIDPYETLHDTLAMRGT